MSDGIDVAQALPYLKPVVPDGDSAPVVELDEGYLPVARPFIGQLLITYLMDKGNRFQYVQHCDLASAGSTEDDLHDRALDNLTAWVRAGAVRVVPHRSIHAVLIDGNFEASLMLVSWLWPDVAEHLGCSDLLAAAPSRDVLAICPADSVVGRRELTEVIERVWPDGDHLLTRDLYRWHGGAWQVMPHRSRPQAP